MESNADLVLYFKAMADETRLSILEMLSCEELCACHILEDFDITQPTLSYHMKILVGSKLVESTKDGNWTRYCINSNLINVINSRLTDLDISNKKISKRAL